MKMVMMVLSTLGSLCATSPIPSARAAPDARGEFWNLLHRDSSAAPSSPPKHQHLCQTRTTTVHLNTRYEEFNPPFYVEKRCLQPPKNSLSSSNVQKCGFDLLDCVQTYSLLYFSRRKAGTGCWEPFSLRVPSGCECMWPVEEFGELQRKDEL